MEGTIGEIRFFAGNFAPRNWAFCDGSPLSIAQYSPLFSVIGTIYGGDGVTNFNLPDLRSRVAVGTGQGQGLENITLGQKGGSETTVMTINQMPAHNHNMTVNCTIPANSGAGTNLTPGSILASSPNAYSDEEADVNLAPISLPITLSPTGSGLPFSIIQPSLVMNYIICVEGIYPTRDY